MTLTDLIKESKGGVAQVKRKESIEEMERALGFDKCDVIYVNSGDDLEDMAEKGDVFADWYEEELRERYEQYQCGTDKRKSR